MGWKKSAGARDVRFLPGGPDCGWQQRRLQWSKEGKPIKSVPAAAKKEQPEEFKELQAAVKDINAMLPAQRERLDAALPRPKDLAARPLATSAISITR